MAGMKVGGPGYLSQVALKEIELPRYRDWWTAISDLNTFLPRTRQHEDPNVSTFIR